MTKDPDEDWERIPAEVSAADTKPNAVAIDEGLVDRFDPRSYREQIPYPNSTYDLRTQNNSLLLNIPLILPRMNIKITDTPATTFLKEDYKDSDEHELMRTLITVDPRQQWVWVAWKWIPVHNGSHFLNYCFSGNDGHYKMQPFSDFNLSELGPDLPPPPPVVEKRFRSFPNYWINGQKLPQYKKNRINVHKKYNKDGPYVTYHRWGRSEIEHRPCKKWVMENQDPNLQQWAYQVHYYHSQYQYYRTQAKNPIKPLTIRKNSPLSSLVSEAAANQSSSHIVPSPADLNANLDDWTTTILSMYQTRERKKRSPLPYDVFPHDEYDEDVDPNEVTTNLAVQMGQLQMAPPLPKPQPLTVIDPAYGRKTAPLTVVKQSPPLTVVDPAAATTPATPTSGDGGTVPPQGPQKKPRKVPLDARFHHFRAFECDTPASVTDHSSVLDQFCPEVEEKEIYITKKNVHYQLVQRERYQRVSGFKCTVEQSSFHLFCGAFDHMTIDPRHTLFGVPSAVTGRQCREMVKSKAFVAPDMERHSLTLSVPKRFTYFTHGNVWYHSGEMKCEGRTVVVGEKAMDYIVRAVQYKVLIEEEEFAIDNAGQVMAVRNHETLPCKGKDEECEISDATYVWEFDEHFCPLAKKKDFVATEVQGPKETVVMSSDGTLIRLIKGDQVSECNKIMWLTNYPGLYLVPLQTPSGQMQLPQNLFLRELHPSEVNIHTFVSNKDDFLYHKLDNKIAEEYRKVIGQNCKRQLRYAKLDHWILRTTPGYATYSRGPGNFASVNGEVVYSFSCHPVIVRAISLNKCFTKLPVVLVSRPHDPTFDFHSYSLGNNQLPPQELIRFMEPVTRRLYKSGVPVPCSAIFPAKYLTIRNKWIATRPEIQLANPPNKISLSMDNTTYEYAFEDINFGNPNSGTDSRSQMEAYQRYLEFGNFKEAVSYQMAAQTHGFHPGGFISPQMAYPSETLIGGSWYSMILGPIMGFLRQLGEWTSIGIAIILIFRVSYTILHALYSICALYQVHGCSLALLWWPCMEFLHTRNYVNNNRRPGRRRPFPFPIRTLRNIIGEDTIQAFNRREMERDNQQRDQELNNLYDLPPGAPEPEDDPPNNQRLLDRINERTRRNLNSNA